MVEQIDADTDSRTASDKSNEGTVSVILGQRIETGIKHQDNGDNRQGQNSQILHGTDNNENTKLIKGGKKFW
jgi:hypothetical protein